VLINGAGRIATMQPALFCSLSVVWGCQQAGEYAIKGRLIDATQPWFVFRAHAVGYSELISVQDVRSIAGTTVLQAALCSSFVCP
jgi:hypothetical protein